MANPSVVAPRERNVGSVGDQSGACVLPGYRRSKRSPILPLAEPGRTEAARTRFLAQIPRIGGSGSDTAQDSAGSVKRGSAQSASKRCGVSGGAEGALTRGSCNPIVWRRMRRECARGECLSTGCSSRPRTGPLCCRNPSCASSRPAGCSWTIGAARQSIERARRGCRRVPALAAVLPCPSLNRSSTKGLPGAMCSNTTFVACISLPPRSLTPPTWRV